MERLSYAMLHCHTEHSLKDSPLHISDFVERAKEMGCAALAITDHGTGTGLIEFRDNCKRVGIKPILGVELYVKNRWSERAHIIVLAKNKAGYEKMCSVLSKGWEHPEEPVKDYIIPVNEMEDIVALAGGDCIITSACVSGILSSIYAFNTSNQNKRVKLVKELKKCVSPDDEYYVGNLTLKSEIEQILAEVERSKTEKKQFLSECSPARMKSRKKALATYDEDSEAFKAAQKSYESDIAKIDIFKNELRDLLDKETELENKLKIIKKEIVKAQKGVERYNAIKDTIDTIPFMSDEEIEYEVELAAKELKSIFKEFFYIELQYHGMVEEKKAMTLLAKIARKLDIPMVATNDSHIAVKEQVFERTLVKTTLFNKWEDASVYDKELYMKSDEELKQSLLKILPADVVNEAIDNIRVIADLCEEISFESHIPAYIDDTGKRLTEEESFTALESLARSNINIKYPGEWDEVHEERLIYELSVVKELGYCGYILIVADVVNFAKKYGIALTDEQIACSTSPGRGSGAGCIINYLTGITKIDPIKYGLKFERFLNKDRVSMPDIDTDYSEETRYPAIEYVRNKYGAECVAGIRTISTQQPKKAIRNAARIARMERDVSLPEDEKEDNKKHFLALGDALAKSIPVKDVEGKPVILRNYADILKASFKDKDSIDVIDKAIAIEGTITNLGVHAAGIIISDGKPLREIIPVLQLKQRVVSCDMCEAEDIGLLKMDFLGLRNLDIITECQRRIKRRTGKYIDIDQIPFENTVFNEIFCKGKTNCVFQCESDGMKSVLKRFGPESFEDLILLVAAYRPGPMEFIPEMIENKHGRGTPHYILPELEGILSVTYGQPIYQEQLMDIFHICAGFSLGQADIIRRYMSKKKVEKFLEFKPQFIEGFIKHGADRGDAERYWDSLEDFSKYAFNKSHAAVYAMIAYQTAYLKYYYPLEYMCACLNHPPQNTKISALIRECRSLGIEILAPDINQSSDRFEIRDNKILYSLGSIEGIKSAAEQVIKERDENGPYLTVADFVERTMPDSGNLKSYIKAGVFDDIAREKRMGLLNVSDDYCEILKKIKEYKKKIAAIENEAPKTAKEKKNHKAKMEKYTDMLELKRAELQAVYISSEIEDRTINLHNEHTVLGAYLSSHPLDEFMHAYTEPDITTIEQVEIGNERINFVGLIEDLKVKKRKKDGLDLAFFTFEDISSDVSVICPVYVYEKCRQYINEGDVIRLTADVLRDDEEDEQDENSNPKKKLLARSIVKCYPRKSPIIASFSGKADAEKLACALQCFRKEYGHPVYVHDTSSGLLTLTKMTVDSSAINLQDEGFIINFIHK